MTANETSEREPTEPSDIALLLFEAGGALEVAISQGNVGLVGALRNLEAAATAFDEPRALMHPEQDPETFEMYDGETLLRFFKLVAETIPWIVQNLTVPVPAPAPASDQMRRYRVLCADLLELVKYDDDDHGDVTFSTEGVKALQAEARALLTGEPRKPQ